MEYSAIVRKINETEKDIIISSFSEISYKLSSFLQENQAQFYVLISKKKRKNKTIFPQIFFMPKNLISTFESVNMKSKIASIGIYFGFIKRGEFLLSLEAIEFLDKKGLIPDEYKLYVNKNGEKAILYGNDIQKGRILPSLELNKLQVQKGTLIFIFNQLKEFLSIGLGITSSKEINGADSEEIIIRNLTDKGYYLRESQ